MSKTYNGNVEITDDNAAEWAKKLSSVMEITGDLRLDAKAELPQLQTVGGNLRLYAKAELQAPQLQTVGGNLWLDAKAELQAPQLQTVGGNLWLYAKQDQSLEEKLWKKYRKTRRWFLCDLSSKYMLQRRSKNIICRIDGVDFDRPLFDRIRLGEISAAEVFVIQNMEQRRVAWARLDKTKIADFDLLTIDSVSDDGYGHPMRIISFTRDGYEEPFLFLNCFCPSTGREYYLETRQKNCASAKGCSFGLDGVSFGAEY